LVFVGVLMPTRVFFLTATDTKAWLAAVQEATPIIFCEAEGSGKRPRTYDLATAIPDLGKVSLLPSGVASQRELLVHEKPYSFVPKVYKEARGTTHAVYSALNPGTVTIRLAGVASEEHIAPGDLSTHAGDAAAQKLARVMWKALDRLGLVKGNLGIGPEALDLHRAGYRLCRALAADPTNDVRFPAE
jgi:hypothetical protein